MKVSELKGARNLIRIECSCSAVWILYGNKAFDKREKVKFIATHAEHDLLSFKCISKVTK